MRRRRTPRASAEAQRRRRARPLLAELRAIYRQADALYGGHDCPRTTVCCRFGRTGREPYVTRIEVAAIEQALAALGRPVPRASPAAPLDEAYPDEQPCPLLAATGACLVYAVRPIGCRTHYCLGAGRPGGVSHPQVLALVRRIADLAGRYEPGGDRGRPLRRALTPRGVRRAVIEDRAQSFKRGRRR